MQYKKLRWCFLVCALCAISMRADAAYMLKNGKLVDTSLVATLPPPEHFRLGMEAMESHHWKEAAKQFEILTYNFPNSPMGQEAYYYLGVTFYHLAEFDFANDAFSQYLKSHNNPHFFLEAIEYKFAIAEQFKCGAKRHFFGTKQLPKWATGRSLALTIYDEVVAAMPGGDIAAQALYAKGCLLWNMREYRESIDAFQMVIRRFPKHELAPDCYLSINRVYLDQSRFEFQNPDILAFAQINTRRFRQDFPREERLDEAEQGVLEIKEVYARGLYETGQFYERVQHFHASVIYYHNTIDQFPETCVAQLCRQRLAVLDPAFCLIEEEASCDVSIPHVSQVIEESSEELPVRIKSS